MGTTTVMVFWTTRRETLRTLATICRRWRKVSRHFDSPRDARWALAAMRRMARDIRGWSHPTDLARVRVQNCADLKCLTLAVEAAMPRAQKTNTLLRHIADAASSGCWSADDSDTEEYKRTAQGWAMTRERGRSCDEGDE